MSMESAVAPLDARLIKAAALRYVFVRWLLASLVLVPIAIVGAPLLGIGPAAAYVAYCLAAAHMSLPESQWPPLAKAGAIHGACFALAGWLTFMPVRLGDPDASTAIAARIALHSLVTSGILWHATRSWLCAAAPFAACAAAIGTLYLDHYTTAAGAWNAVNGLGLCLWAALHRAEATRLAEHRGVFCLSCGYDVRAVTSAKCPECGTRIPSTGAAVRREDEREHAQRAPVTARTGRPQWVIDGAEAGRARRSGASNVNEETRFGEDQ